MANDTLTRSKHVQQLIDGIKKPLPSNYMRLVPLQTWTVYWNIHSLALLDERETIQLLSDDIVKFIRECLDPVGGGYGGGPGQISHLATSYAAVNALVTLANKAALDSIDRKSLLNFIVSMKQADGSFTMHDGGEIDTRASYCAITLVKLLNMPPSPEVTSLMDKCADYILSCQTYEGGFGSVPGAEAHGGYTFCSVAALFMLKQLHRCDIDSLLRWLTNRQLRLEGGFNGRSNKLVDTCYSFWQGALFPILHSFLQFGNAFNHSSDLMKDKAETEANGQQESNNDCPPRDTDINHDHDYDLSKDWLFDRLALQNYILTCQDEDGLLKDRPDSASDFYHTCYSLSGLSIAQHSFDSKQAPTTAGNHSSNLLERTHPVFNLTIECLKFCVEYFKETPPLNR